MYIKMENVIRNWTKTKTMYIEMENVIRNLRKTKT